MRAFLPQMQPAWLRADGGLDEQALLTAFLAFWQQHGEPLLKGAPYHKVVAQLVMMAFLHRIVSGRGSVEREYAVGNGHIDLFLRYGRRPHEQMIGIELEVWRDGQPDPLVEGLAQLDEYLSGLGLGSGWLILFDQRTGLPPISERTFTETTTSPAARRITVIRA